MNRRSFAIIVSTLALLSLPLGRAAANSAPPPAVNWFYIEYAGEARPEVQGVQVWGCAEEVCVQPELIQAWGECSAAECLADASKDNTGANTIASRLDCGPVRGQLRCRSAAFRYGYPYFRLAVQFDDRLRTHPNALPLPGPEAYGKTIYWQVAVTEDALDLAETVEQPGEEFPVPPFAAFFGISMVIELLVFGIYGAWRWKLELSELILRLALVGLINLLTYPVVWGFFPMLLRFTPPGYRSAGWGLMAFTLIIGGLLWVTINQPTVRRRVAGGIATALAFAIGIACLLLGAFAAGYGSQIVTASGLPASAAIILAELYAVVVEGLLLYGFTRRQVGLREALLLSLAMNAASFLVGLLLAW